MTRLSVIAVLLSVVLMSSGLTAQDSNSKVEVKKLTPELKEKYSNALKDITILRPQQENELFTVPMRPLANPVEGHKSIKDITHSKKPPEISPSTKEFLEKQGKIKSEKKSHQLQGQMTQLPENIRYVGEFEESQAVLVAIPSSSYTSIENQYYQVFTHNFMYYYDAYTPNNQKTQEAMMAYFINCEPGDAIFWPYIWGLSNSPNEIYVVKQPQVIWRSDFGLFNGDTTYRYIWANLINAIQQEAEAWIRITAIGDTTALKNYMSLRGMPLTNYRFFNDIIGEDAFWVRDWGPHGFYYDDNGTQKLGFHDAVYYTGRPFDDIFPRKLLDEVGYNWYDLQIQMEGGNMMTDGWGNVSHGDVVYRNNDTIIFNYKGQSYKSNPDGQYTYDYEEEMWYITEPIILNKQQLDARKKAAFNINDLNLFKSLEYDGGTGHIDLWIKQFDEESMLIANMTDKYSGLTDYQTIQQNRAYLANKTTTFGTKYRFLNAPMPKSYDYHGWDTNYTPPQDGDMPINNNQYNLDPRGYLNGIVVNKSYIYPSFSRGPADPCWQSDEAAREVLKKLLPGYKLVPIDSKVLTPGGGAIHCITMQIPQAPDKLITMKHKPIRDYIPLAESFNISVELISNTDANKFVIYWKKVSDTEWQAIEMATYDNKFYGGTITGNFVKEDTIRYYIAAQKDNEVRKCAPITGGQGADDGYYQFYFDDVSIDELYGFEPKASVIASIYPNPVTNYLNIIFENATEGNVTIEIINPLGQSIMTPVNKYFNKGVFIFDINDLELTTGIYFIKMTTNTGISTANFAVK